MLSAWLHLLVASCSLWSSHTHLLVLWMLQTHSCIRILALTILFAWDVLSLDLRKTCYFTHVLEILELVSWVKSLQILTCRLGRLKPPTRSWKVAPSYLSSYLGELKNPGPFWLKAQFWLHSHKGSKAQGLLGTDPRRGAQLAKGRSILCLGHGQRRERTRKQAPITDKWLQWSPLTFHGLNSK